MEMLSWPRHEFDLNDIVVINHNGVVVRSDNMARWKVVGCRIGGNNDSIWEYYIVSYPDENYDPGRWIPSNRIQPVPPPLPPPRLGTQAKLFM